MTLAPLTVLLTKFEQLEILRQEVETREAELRETERRIRELLFETERQKYLKSLHALFGDLKLPPEAGQMQTLYARREALHQALETMRKAMTALETETRGQAAPAPVRAGAAPGARRGFESFEEFRNQRKAGGGANA